MDNTLLQAIKSTGIESKEAEVYLALLELGQGTVGQIAKLTNLKRPTIYVILEKLIKTGYVSQLPDKKINQYQAADASVILHEKRVAFKNFAEILPLLQTLHNKGKSRPRIQYIETKKGIWNIYEEMNDAKEAFFISDYTVLEKNFPNCVNKWTKGWKSGLYRVKGRHLIPDSPENKKLGTEIEKANQKVKILPSVKNYNMDFSLSENKLAITSLGEEPFMVLIESLDLVDSLKPIFEIVWKAGRII